MRKLMTALIMLLVLAIVGCDAKTDNNDNEQEVS